MKKLIVNKIIEDGTGTHGLTVIDRCVMDNIRTAYGEGKVGGYHFKASQVDKFYSIARFFQYVGLIIYDKEQGYTMRLSDFKGSIDNVLDEYLKLMKNDWEKEDTDNYVRIVQEIIDDKNGELAEFKLFLLPPQI